MNSPAPSLVNPDPGLISWTHWMYALHAVAALMGLFGSAFVATAFVAGFPSIIAVIMNYVRRGAARGTWLDSHFSWQLRTFWFAVLWVVIISVVSFPLMLVLVGFGIFWIGIAILGIWIIYRVARGWLRLKDGQAI
jgi:uncharacterized membrane protein